MPAHRQGTLRVKHKSTHNFARQHNLITPVYHHEGEVERTLLLFLKKKKKKQGKDELMYDLYDLLKTKTK